MGSRHAFVASGRKCVPGHLVRTRLLRRAAGYGRPKGRLAVDADRTLCRTEEAHARHVQPLFEDLDKWIRKRLRSKVRGSKARTVSNAKMPTRHLTRLGLVSLGAIRRQRLSPT